MPTFPAVPAKYHLQDTPETFCGPASLMMVLQRAEALNPSNPPADLIDQRTSYSYMHDGPNWDTSPDGLAAGLEHFKSPNVTARFSVGTAPGQMALTQLVVAALCAPDAIPPAILSSNCNHWVVPASVTTDVDPTTGPYRPSCFIVNDPQHIPKNGGIPPHLPNDACGTGNHSGHHYHAPLTWFYSDVSGGWLDELAPCGSTQAPYDGDCVGVFSDVVAAIGPIQPPRASEWTAENRRVKTRDELITEDDARGAAVFAVRAHRLASPAADVHAGFVRLVQQLDREETYYYIVALYENDAFLGVIRIDAWSGEPAVMSADSAYEVIPDAATVARELSGRRPARPYGLWTLLRHGTYSVSPVLVWRRCVESPVPFSPFYQITIGARVLLLDAHGTLHDTLTDLHPRGPLCGRR